MGKNHNKRKKHMPDSEKDMMYMQALQGKKIPLLPLDARWHALFPDFRKNKEIRQIEKELDQLIKKQGQTDNDLKDYDKAKKVLTQNVLNNMTDGHEFDSPVRLRKQEKNQKLIAELNEKIVEAKSLQERLPAEIVIKNRELLIACMKVCYQELMDNTDEIVDCEEHIRKLREEIKDNILHKQDMEMRNTEVYKYMHNLLGADVVEIFDREQKVWRGNLEENKLEDAD